VQLQKGWAFTAGENRTLEGCARASLSYVAEVARRRRTQRSVRFPLHPIWKSYGDGSLGRSQQAGVTSAARRLRSKGRRGSDRSGNPSRDRYSRPISTRAGARVSPWRWKAPRIKAADLIFTEGFAVWSRRPQGTPLAKARRGELGKRQGCQRHGPFGSASSKKPRTNPSDPPKRIGRRENARSPSLLVVGASPAAKGEVKASKRCWEPMRRGYS